MPEGLVPRMAIEWGFLILLSVGAAVADLRPGYIIVVMAIGWILVVLVELLAWRARPGYAVAGEAMEVAPAIQPPPSPLPPIQDLTPPPPLAEMPPAPPVQEAPPVPGYDFEFTPPAPEPAAVEEETAVVSAAPPAAEGAVDPAHPYAPAPERDRLREEDQRVVYRLEPLKPRPRRRYRFFGPHERAEQPEGDEQPRRGEEG